MRKIIAIAISLVLHVTVQGQKAKVLIFLAAQCPCAYNHEETFASMANKYGKTVDFVAVFVDRNDQPKEIREMLKSLHWDIPFVIDRNKAYQNKFKPTVTTECMLISPAGEVLYRGAVDDSPLNLGQVKNFFLRDALEDYTNNKPIRIKQGQPVGCLINS